MLLMQKQKFIMLKNTIISIAVCDDQAIDRSDIVSLIQKYADERPSAAWR